ncbi:MAG: hypothetical protein PVJ14_10440 [Chromatiales bacterium]|jgi:hypothetical protein
MINSLNKKRIFFTIIGVLVLGIILHGGLASSLSNISTTYTYSISFSDAEDSLFDALNLNRQQLEIRGLPHIIISDTFPGTESFPAPAKSARISEPLVQPNEPPRGLEFKPIQVKVDDPLRENTINTNVWTINIENFVPHKHLTLSSSHLYGPIGPFTKDKISFELTAAAPDQTEITINYTLTTRLFGLNLVDPGSDNEEYVHKLIWGKEKRIED